MFHNERLRQEALEKAGHYSPIWTVLRSLHPVYGTRKIRGCTIIDTPPFFESTGREESADLMNLVWDVMLPGEQESAKKIIADENDWIIWWVKPP